MANQVISKKPIYNLNLVLQETGIKADTLRAWERRYELPQPNRTAGGHRLFSEYDIETIKWLMARQEEGMRISRAVALWREIESGGQDPLVAAALEQTAQTLAAPTEQESQSLALERQKWVQACLTFDEAAAEQILEQAFAQFSLQTVCLEILQAGLAEIGMLWYEGKASVQQEHFASELATRRLHSLLSAAPPPIREETILVGCPPNENHTFSALMITLFLRYRSWNVIYLGANVPHQRFNETVKKTSPDLVVMAAMRLATAAELLESARLLKEFDIPLAFGGLAFTLIPDLPSKIPGHYLGDQLDKAVSNIETLLSGPMPTIDTQPQQKDFSETISQFLESKQLIETQALQALQEKTGSPIPQELLLDANEYLAQDIVAALTLGDISYLGSNLEWIENLLVHRDLPEGILDVYLQSYSEAAQPYLGQAGQPVVEWLDSITSHS